MNVSSYGVQDLDDLGYRSDPEQVAYPGIIHVRIMLRYGSDDLGLFVIFPYQADGLIPADGNGNDHPGE